MKKNKSVFPRILKPPVHLVLSFFRCWGHILQIKDRSRTWNDDWYSGEWQRAWDPVVAKYSASSSLTFLICIWGIIATPMLQHFGKSQWNNIHKAKNVGSYLVFVGGINWKTKFSQIKTHSFLWVCIDLCTNIHWHGSYFNAYLKKLWSNKLPQVFFIHSMNDYANNAFSI